MVSEWAPVSSRDPAGALLLAAIGVLVVALARSRAPARVPEQLLRMTLLAGLALWAVRASVWFGLALPVAICALARERVPHPATDRGVPVASGLVLAALAVALAVVFPPVRRAMAANGPPRPELTSAPVAAAGWLTVNPQPDRSSTSSPGAPTWSSGWARGSSRRSTPASSCFRRSAGATTWPSRRAAGTRSGSSTRGVSATS